MIVSLGKHVTIKDQQNTFVVSANIYSEKTNDYVKHWDGGTFDNYQEAYDFWDEWEPPKDEINQFMSDVRDNKDYTHYELEIGMWCDDIEYDLPFMNMTLDLEHERT